jgi:hypothetical protein
VHYTGQLNGKPQFEYHQQSLEYIQGKPGDMPKAELVVLVERLMITYIRHSQPLIKNWADPDGI